MIDVKLTNSGDPFEFDVAVREGDTETRHRVTMTESTYRALTSEGVGPERCVEAAFKFLLDREPKESILSSFDITVISRYFPSFEDEISHYM